MMLPLWTENRLCFLHSNMCMKHWELNLTKKNRFCIKNLPDVSLSPFDPICHKRIALCTSDGTKRSNLVWRRRPDFSFFNLDGSFPNRTSNHPPLDVAHRNC